jgi:hypothetical protein
MSPIRPNNSFPHKKLQIRKSFYWQFDFNKSGIIESNPWSYKKCYCSCCDEIMLLNNLS